MRALGGEGWGGGGAKLRGDSARVRLEWLRWVERVGEVEVQNQRWVRSMLKGAFFR